MGRGKREEKRAVSTKCVIFIDLFGYKSGIEEKEEEEKEERKRRGRARAIFGEEKKKGKRERNNPLE